MTDFTFLEKPVIILGHGIRASNVHPGTLLRLGIPVLSSWQGADLVDNYDPNYFGRTGIYGQRTANKILYEADQVISIGNRLTPWNIGHGGLRPEQKLIMVDVDPGEAGRFPDCQFINMDAKEFISQLLLAKVQVERPEWLSLCNSWRKPWIESPAHDDTNGYINSYKLMGVLETHLRPEEIIVCDTGSFMCPVYQSLHVKPPQRLLTGGGLGEMGCGLPGAIGASFAKDKGEILCIMGDGGMMMNLAELQTIKHHNLPIKILVFENDGYAMIKGTHKNMKIPYTGVSKASGISFPDFCKVANSFGIGNCDIKTWNDVYTWFPTIFSYKGPFLAQIHIDPEQSYVPRLQPIIEGTKITPARFDQLSPIHE